MRQGANEQDIVSSSNAAPLITVDASKVGSIFGDVLQQGIFQALRFTGAVLFIAVIDWRLLVVAQVTILLLTATPVLMRSRIINASRNYQEAEAEVLTRASEFLADVLTLKAMSAERWAERILVTNFRNSRSRRLRLQTVSAASNVGYFALWIVYAGTYLFAGLLAFQGRLSSGDVLALGQLMATLAFPSQSLGSVYSSYNAALASLQRIEEFLAQGVFELFREVGTAKSCEDEQLSSPVPLACREIEVAIAGGVTALRDVNLTIEPGEWVAIAGASGAGKSTLTQVLAGLRVPTSGYVLAGGRPLSNWNEEVFRKRVGFAGGDVYLYRGSLFDNVALGRTEMASELVASLLELVGATDIITRLGGIHSPQLEGRKKLSSGERQRIGIARALATSPDLLILDEATNAIDSQSEVAIFQNIRERFPRLTVILIGHRLSTIMQSARIIVLDKGHITEAGLPSTLLSKEGLFKDLVQSQVVSDTN